MARFVIRRSFWVRALPLHSTEAGATKATVKVADAAARSDCANALLGAQQMPAGGTPEIAPLIFDVRGPLERRRVSPAQIAEVVARTVGRLAEEPDLSRLAKSILDQAIALFGARTAHLCLVGGGHTLHLISARNVPQSILRILARFDSHAPLLTAQAALTLRMQVVSDVDQLAPELVVTRRLLEETGCRSMVSVPLIASGKLLGVLTFALPASYSQEQLSSIEAISSIFAAGLANARTIERLRRFTVQLDALRKASLTMGKSLNLSSVVEAALEEAHAISGARHSALRAVMDAPRKQNAVGDSSGLERWAYRGLSKKEAESFRVFVQSSAPLAASQQGSIRLLDQISDLPGTRNLLAVPIRSHEAVLGTLYLIEEEGGEGFSDEDQTAIELLAQHAGNTIEHAKTYQRVLEEMHERKRAETALRASEKERERLRDEWTSIVAHDLRQPINAINLNSNILGSERVPDSDKKTALGHLKASAHQLHRMVGDLLEASKIEVAQLELRKSELDLAKLVTEVIERHSGESKHRIKMQLDSGVPTISADPGRVEQILGNLISNALKYSYPNTDILVRSELAQNEVVLSVANQGAGLESDDLRNLFQRFRRAKSVKTSGDPSGLGLGLYIVKGLVEAHRGRVWAESSLEGSTRVCFSLPLSAKA
jgi:signal transduction histidine kinase